jgi:hypothetical protein
MRMPEIRVSDVFLLRWHNSVMGVIGYGFKEK